MKKNKLWDYAFITKLAGFEHTKFIQNNATHEINDVPLIIWKNIKNWKVIYKFDWYISKSLSDKLPRSVLDKKCIVIPYVGSKLGELAIFQNDFKCHLWSNVAKVELTKEIFDLEYLYYYLKSPYWQLQLFKSKQWSTQPNITMEAIRSTYVTFFDITYQKKIAHILSTLDKKIELNNKINEELEKMAKTLYDYWFVQFDFPDENWKPYKSSGWKMIYNEKLKREIPEGWEVENLKENSLTDLIKPKINKFDWEKIYLATADVQNNDINFQAEKITFEKRPSRANMQPIENSVWFAKMKDSKKVLYFWEYSKNFLEKFILSTWFAWLKCKKEFYLEYIWWFINNDDFEFIKNRLSNWATQKAINNDTMKEIKLIIPKENILKDFHNRTKNIYKKIYFNKIENQKLEELRDWLLPMLMNGQVEVK